MKILSTKQIRQADQFTIQNEPILSVDLMERAAGQLFSAFIEIFPEPQAVAIFAGPGNNGGDGIALARMLADNLYPVQLYIVSLGNPLSTDAQVNLDRLPPYAWLSVEWMESEESWPQFDDQVIIVDALFGSGLTRPLGGEAAKLITYLNFLPNRRLAIDIPSGLFGEENNDNPGEAIFRADHTLTLHCPKMALFMPEHEEYVGQWRVLDIGLMQPFIDAQTAIAHLADADYIRANLRQRRKFDHKGSFGHALMIGGSAGKTGAAILAAKACLRSGAGLVTCHTHQAAVGAFNASVPEIMLSADPDLSVCSVLPDLRMYQAIGIGPGLGTGSKQAALLVELLEKSPVPLVLDADALNILASMPDWGKLLPDLTILTPHPGEFHRLFGKDRNQETRLKRMTSLAQDLNIIILLKGAHTAIALPDGQLWLNNTGNPGMATAGSGDVLTGIILSLLAQGYSPEFAAVAGVYLHGLAGDLAAEEIGQVALIASDIIDFLGRAFLKVH